MGSRPLIGQVEVDPATLPKFEYFALYDLEPVYPEYRPECDARPGDVRNRVIDIQFRNHFGQFLVETQGIQVTNTILEMDYGPATRVFLTVPPEGARLRFIPLAPLPELNWNIRAFDGVIEEGADATFVGVQFKDYPDLMWARRWPVAVVGSPGALSQKVAIPAGTSILVGFPPQDRNCADIQVPAGSSVLAEIIEGSTSGAGAEVVHSETVTVFATFCVPTFCYIRLTNTGGAASNFSIVWRDTNG